MSKIYKAVLYFGSLSYGITRNIYYIPKIKDVEETSYNNDTKKFNKNIKELLIGDKIIISMIGIILMPALFPFALYNDINRYQLYTNKEMIPHYETYLKKCFPYTTLSFSRECIDNNLC